MAGKPDQKIMQQILDLLWLHNVPLSAKDITNSIKSDESVFPALIWMQGRGYAAAKKHGKANLWKLSRRAIANNVRQIGDGVNHPDINFQGITVYQVPPNRRFDPAGDLSEWRVG